jgi:hypothetical protein
VNGIRAGLIGALAAWLVALAAAVVAAQAPKNAAAA